MTKKILYLGLNPAHYSSKGKVTHWPIIKIVPRPLTEGEIQNALTNFETFTHVIATSKSTVAILKEYLERSNIPLHRWAAKATLALGKVTAKHLNACGITPQIIASEETAEGIVHELAQLDLRDSHIFWPHSSEARPVIEAYLLARGISFTSCVLYDPRPNIPGKLPHLKDFDEIVFTSPSTVNAFLEIFDQLPAHAELTPIGPITRDYLQSLLK